MALECNCSICTRSGYLHLLVEADDFTLLCGEETLTSYTFNTRTARHLFCKVCGVKSFYIPRSNPHGYSVNVRCLDHGTCDEVRIEGFDGANWEASVGDLVT